MRGDFLKQISVNLPNKPGALYKFCDLLAKANVNIASLYVEPKSEANKEGIVRMATNDEAAAVRALKNNGYESSVEDLIIVNLSDRPGELAKTTLKLTHAGVNIDNLFILDTNKGVTRIAFTSDNLTKAQEVL